MRVVIVEDQALLREGLARLFADGGHEIVRTLGSAEHLLQTVDDQRPDLVVLDVRMPPTFTDEGARAAREIKARHPDTGVLVLSQHIETTHVVTLATSADSATCSRTGSSTWRISSRPPNGSPAAGPRWTPKSSPASSRR